MKDSVGRRVLIIVQNLPVPFDRRVWLEAVTLTENGYKVSVISPKSKGHKGFEVLQGVALYRYKAPTETKGILGYLFEFAYCWTVTFLLTLLVAAREGFDIIHACNPPDTFWLIGRFYKLFGKKFIFDHHDLAPEMYLAKYEKPNALLYRGLRLLEKLSFNTADVLLAPNESHREIAMGRGGVNGEKIFVVRSGPDFNRIKIKPAEAQLRENRGYLIAYLGEMCLQDGVDYLLRAAKILRDELGQKDVLFVIMGGGTALGELRQYNHDLGLEDFVKFTGRVTDEDMCRYLSTADLCVDPDPLSEWSDKSTMNKVLEYMAFARPIVAFDLKENRRSAGPAAVYATPNDEHCFASLIKSLLGNERLRKKMGAAGKKRVEEKLSWDHTKLNLICAYARLCPRDTATAKAEEFVPSCTVDFSFVDK